MTKPLTSRQRMLAALECHPPDHTPCAFMMYKGLKDGCRDYLHFLQAQLDLGLDVVVELPARQPVVVDDAYNLHGLPVRYASQVRVREWGITEADGQQVLVKEYETSDGTLRVEVIRTSTWRWGEHVPFLDDELVPAGRKRLVEGPQDLPALCHLLQPPTDDEIEAYMHESQPYLEFARQYDLLVAGGWGVGADMLGWLCGLKESILFSFRQPNFLQELLGMIEAWNRSRMLAAFKLPLDLYIRRAWYENTDYWTPAAWRKFLLPGLKREADLAHQAGVKFGYLLTARAMPLIEGILEAGVDVLVGVDPREYDLAVLKEKAHGRLCLWGGVNGHLTVEAGTPAQVRAEVETALRTLAPGGGFILSPVDNVRQFTPQSEANGWALIEAWKMGEGT